MTDHNHRAGVRCDLPGCGDQYGSGVSYAVDKVLRTVEPGRTVARSYITECLSAEIDLGKLSRGHASLMARQAKRKKTSSRGSRLTVKVVRRLQTLARSGAVDFVGVTHVLVIDMDRAGLLPGDDREDAR